MTKDKHLLDLIYKYRPYPPFLEIEVTTVCGISCIFCERQYWTEKSKNMSFEQFKYILDQFPDLKFLGETGIGSSFLNKDFMRILRYTKSKEIYVELYDTLFYTNDNILEELVALGIERIIVSLDAATKETYEYLRKGIKFDTVMNNVLKLNSIKRQRRQYFPEIGFHFIITKDNIGEVIPYLELIHSLHIDVAIVQFSRMLHDFPQVHDMFIEVDEETRCKIMEVANKLRLPVQWNADLPKDKPPINQCSSFEMPFIFNTGEVISCCCENEQNDRKWQRETSLGNIFKTPFRDIWNGKKYKTMIDSLQKGIVPECCSRCVIHDLGK
jgi:MoaA/NifB/PqqE/SkfB family radical SAM enzyme